MNKKWGALAIAIVMIATASAQTLFTYGKYNADAKEFLRAFNKNNEASPANKAKAMREYLDLYIASRLKIREAYDRGYDTLPQIKNDIESLRSQIIENYLNDPKVVDKLLKEAFSRSLKDIHTGHIYISFRNAAGIIDAGEAENKANEVYEKLKKGEDFFKLAGQYSSDPAATSNKGDIGYITVFTLPYEFENIIYNTVPGKFSAPIKSKIGFHIFKNLGERKAIGKMKAAQILLSFPPDADAAAKQGIARLADSLYQRLLKGDDIAKLATQFSNDYVSAASGGVMPDLGIGQYDPVFERAAFGLAKNGDITKPILTAHGYHIVKRIGTVPVVTDPKNKSNLDDLKLKLNQSDRLQYSKNLLLDKLIKETIKKHAYSEKELWIWADSLLEQKQLVMPVKITNATPLFSLGQQAFTVNDFINYARTWRYKADGSGTKPYPQLMDEFIHRQAEDYYKANLEDFNEDFRYQMSEFKDGNLFFEIMQQEIWSKAQNDTAALRGWYDKNRNIYRWKQSADAVIFFCSDDAIAKIIYDQVKKNPRAWRVAAEALSEKLVADSGRYEFEQIPNALKSPLRAGLITSPVKNKTDGSVSFAYILKTYPANLQRSFTEARGMVINDYQLELEKKWVTELKNKYPVKINEDVWRQISK